MLTEKDLNYTYHQETAQIIPPHTLEALIRYRDHGLPPGSFLTAFLSNNLMEALGRADIENLQNFAAIGYFIYNAIPERSHGSMSKVATWIEERSSDMYKNKKKKEQPE